MIFLLYCFASGCAYAAVFRKYVDTWHYWAGLAALCVFNALLGAAFKGE